MKIFLIGYMGSGKSKAGAALARYLNYTFIDTDLLVEIQTGKKIASLFDENGEEKFREIEAGVLRSLKPHERMVVATGGGLPCFHGNLEWMNEHGITVYLEANPGLLFHRLVRERKGRPLIEKLKDVELMEQISRHIAEREPVYMNARIKVPAANTDVKKMAEAIQKLELKK